MIKKLMILLLVTITIFSFNNMVDVKADSDPQIDWWVVNTHEDYYVLYGVVDIPVATDTILFTIPETTYSMVETVGGGSDSYISFYKESDDSLILELDWYDTFGNQIAGNFDLDLSVFEVSSSVPLYMTFSIHQSFNVAPASTYEDYVEDNDNIEFYYYNPDYRELYFTRDETVNYNLMALENVTIPYNTYSIALDFRDLEQTFYAKYEGTFSSYIRLYDDNDASIDLIYLFDYVFLDSEYVIIDIPYDTYDLNEAIYFSLYIIVDDNNMDALDSANRNMVVDFNKDINVVYFMSQSTLLSTSVLLTYGGVPTAPADPTPPTGFEFTGWFLENGDIYNFTHLGSDDFTDNVIHIYAYFRVAGTSSDYGTTDDTPDTGTNIYNVLSAFGFATDVGFIFIYLGLIVLVSVGLVVVRISGFIVLVVDIMITALFMYLGFLPLYVIALVFITLVVGMLFYMGGVNSE